MPSQRTSNIVLGPNFGLAAVLWDRITNQPDVRSNPRAYGPNVVALPCKPRRVRLIRKADAA